MSLATGNVASALVYLQVASVAGMVRSRLRRLRQPKYLIGAIAGAAYLYFFLFQRVMTGPGSPHTGRMNMPTELIEILGPLVALGLFIALVSAWIFPNDRAALGFTEAEAAFLFPAPISRRGLIHFSVLRAQVAILLSVLVMSLLLRRGGTVGVNPLRYAAALWLLFATMRLHFLGASFTRERLLDLGLRPAWRRAGVIAVVALLAALCIAWARANVAAPVFDDLRGLAAYVSSTLGSGPAHVVLTPFRWLAGPMLASSDAAFWRAVPAALALLALHYAWVVRSQVSFEEATIDLARRRAERTAAMREGRFRLRTGPRRARRAPFALAPRGSAPVAFLWKGLIAAGPLWRLRTLAIATLVVVVAMWWLGLDPARATFVKFVGIVSLALAAWGTVVGPMLYQRGLRETLDHLDVLRAMPLRGWQIAVGQLATPVAILVPVQWLMLLAAALAFGGVHAPGWLTPGLFAAFGLAALLLLPLLCALMLCVPFAGVLLFPGWSLGGRAGGIDVMGQRLIFGGVFLIALALSLLPATLVAALLLFLLRGVAGPAPAVVAATLAAAAVLAVEVMLMTRWLGRRIERIDVASELR